MWSRPAVFRAAVYGELAVGPEVAMVLRTLAEERERGREWKTREMKVRKERGEGKALTTISLSVSISLMHSYGCTVVILFALQSPLLIMHCIKAHCGC